MISEDTKYILNRYAMEKFKAAGVPWLTNTQSQYNELDIVFNTIKPLLLEIEHSFKRNFCLEEEFSDTAQLESVLFNILDEIFERQINTGRIMSIIVLLGVLIDFYMKHQQLQRIPNLINGISHWMDVYGVNSWIRKQGGWKVIINDINGSRRFQMQARLFSAILFCLDVWFNNVLHV